MANRLPKNTLGALLPNVPNLPSYPTQKQIMKKKLSVKSGKVIVGEDKGGAGGVLTPGTRGTRGWAQCMLGLG